VPASRQRHTCTWCPANATASVTFMKARLWPRPHEYVQPNELALTLIRVATGSLGGGGLLGVIES
jgi:hypothetical protein